MARFILDPQNLPRLTPEQEARQASMTEEEIEAIAAADPDNPPSTEEELNRGVAGRRIRLLRGKLGLSQSEFAERYRINVARLRDWEQGRSMPDSVVLAYLTVIEREPEAVKRALEAV